MQVFTGLDIEVLSGLGCEAYLIVVVESELQVILTSSYAFLPHNTLVFLLAEDSLKVGLFKTLRGTNQDLELLGTKLLIFFVFAVLAQ